MRRVTIDIVTVCLDSSATIARCLDSVRKARNYVNNFVVIDGVSTDGTLDILGRNQDIISTLVSEPDQGIADAFNKGISRCRSDFVLILNADDWLVDDALDKVSADLSLQDEVVSPLLSSYQANELVGLFRSIPEHIPRYNSMLHPGALVRRDLYDTLGGYDPQLRVAMDYDFFCRCYRNGRSIRVVDLPLVCFSEGGKSRQLKYRVFRESFYLRKKYFSAYLPIFETRQLLSRWVGDVLEMVSLKDAVKKVLRKSD